MIFRLARLAGALALFVGVLSPLAAPSKAAEVPRVLVWGGAYGFRHTSITAGERAMLQLAQSTGRFSVTVTENPLDLSMSTLKDYDVLMWISTTGKAPMTQQQRDEVVRWSACGGGNIGIHAAADAEYGWAEHAEIFGVQFDSHPKGAGSGAARMLIEKPKDPIVKGWGGAKSFMFDDEYYRWRTAKRVPGISLPRNAPGVEVLLSLDEKTVGGSIQQSEIAYEHHQPIAWKKTFRNGGRVFYNNMGHSDGTWDVPAYQTSLVEAVKWVSGKHPKASCLDSTTPLPHKAAPPSPKASLVGHSCAVPALRPRSGSTWEHSGTPKRLTSTDTVELAAGIPGNLSWGGQTYVVDLASKKGKRADVTVDLSWQNPLDDYDLDVVTAWGTYGEHKVTGSTKEHLVMKDVPTCAILHITGDNMLATGTAGPTLSVTVGRVR
ncbi:MAG: ThuA domain-containing protein [Actinomycetota bacterium]|nr:ThuA domain-containing protein [Actinomycetota bacterium]